MITGEPQDADVISDTLALSIAQHNRHFAELCGPMVTLKRGWQAVRAAVEQHTVAGS